MLTDTADMESKHSQYDGSMFGWVYIGLKIESKE